MNCEIVTNAFHLSWWGNVVQQSLNLSQNRSSSPALLFPWEPRFFFSVLFGLIFCLFNLDLGYPGWGALFATYSSLIQTPAWTCLLPRPHSKPPPLLSSPLLSSSSSSSSSWVALGTDSPLPAHCHQTMSAFMCRRKHPQIHRHRVTPTQTRFVGFPRVKHSSVSALCCTPLAEMIFAQPVGFAGQLFTPCAHLYLKTTEQSAPQPRSHGSGGRGVNLKPSEWQMAACRHMSKQERLLQNCNFRLFQRLKKSNVFLKISAKLLIKLVKFCWKFFCVVLLEDEGYYYQDLWLFDCSHNQQ